MYALQVKQMIIDHPAVHIDILQSTVNVSLKITYEFNTLTVNELVEVINYETTLTMLGSISVSTVPQLTIFKSTGTYITMQDIWVCLYYIKVILLYYIVGVITYL